MIESEGSYPDIFDYRPPSFTPCGIECSDAIPLLTQWKDAIDSLDPDAAKELVFFHRKEFPEMLAHEEYVKQEFERRALEYGLDRMKRGV
jgi:hypothetical protein